MINGNRKTILVQMRRQRRYGNGNGKLLSLVLKVISLVVVAAISGTLLTTGIGVGTAVAAYLSLTKDLPDPTQVETSFQQANSEFFETTKIYDRTGKTLLYEVIDPRAGDRQWVALNQIPALCRQATIAIEDKSFYENPGVDLYGITRAFVSNLQGKAVQGASSITQQVVKNTLIDPEERYQQTYERKIKEGLLAMEISRRYSKDQILEWYLNSNHYGNLAYGIDAAARVYFGKTVGKLNLGECSMLAAIPQFPAMNPIDNPDAAKERQALALDAMVRQGYITPEESVNTKFEKLQISGGVQERFDIKAPHFAIYARKWLEDHFGPDVVYRGGLRVFTTLDLELNNKAQEILAQHVKKLAEDKKNVNNGAVVVITPKTGEILAMVGSVDYWNDAIDGKFNVATGLRQPGSSFKPFTYVTLLSQGYSPATSFLDVRTAFEQPGFPPYVPENYDRKYHGLVRMRVALARSYNIPAVRALEMAGIDNVIRTAHKMGITTLNRGLDYYGLALTLGGGEVKVVDMAYAFSVFANGGVMAGTEVLSDAKRPGFRTLDPVPVLRVEDRNGKVLWEYKQPQTTQVLDPRLAFQINSILSDNSARWAAFGQPNVLELDRPAAAKTGTTNDFRDNWTIGYTPQVAVGVWVGNTDNTEMKEVTGLTGAAPVWHDVMMTVLKDKPVEPFVRPEGLVERSVDAVSGLLPTKYSPMVKELFIPGTEPTSYDNTHQAFLLDKETGKLATVFTPPEKVEEKVYEIYPPEAAEWIAQAEVPQPPNEYDTVYGPAPTAGDVSITGPKAYSAVSGGIVISGNAKGGDFAIYRLAFGQGMNPSAWTQIGGDHGEQVENNVLEFWDTAGLAEGLYSLQLTVVDHDQSMRQATIQVTVDNKPPTIKLTYPPNDEKYEAPKDEWIVFNADVADNFGIDRVEFFMDVYTQPFAIRYIAPYNDKLLFTPINPETKKPAFRAEVIGTRTAWAVVYDKAGNKAESNKIKLTIELKKPK
jgi:penicillin-binding protein 1C